MTTRFTPEAEAPEAVTYDVRPTDLDDSLDQLDDDDDQDDDDQDDDDQDDDDQDDDDQDDDDQESQTTSFAMLVAKSDPADAPKMTIQERRALAVDAFKSADPSSADASVVAGLFAAANGATPTASELLDQSFGAAVLSDLANVKAWQTFHSAVTDALTAALASKPRAVSADPAIAARQRAVLACARLTYVSKALDALCQELGADADASYDALRLVDGELTDIPSAELAVIDGTAFVPSDALVKRLARLADGARAAAVRATKGTNGAATRTADAAFQVNGAEFGATYKGVTSYMTARKVGATVGSRQWKGWQFTVNGVDYDSPTAAAKSVNGGGSVNGTTFWQPVTNLTNP